MMQSVFAGDAFNVLQQWTFPFIKCFEVFAKGIDVGGWVLCGCRMDDSG
jgi:hypothetical protein